MNERGPLSNNSFAALRRFVRPRTPVEYCELCSAELAGAHQHLIEPARRQLVCVCGDCAILFGSQGATKYLRVPRRIRALPDFRLSAAQWESLLIPISLAYFYQHSARHQVVACYPSPAGATEALLDQAAWDEIAAANPVIQGLAPEVEALLVNRTGRTGETHEYFIVPIDECFKLVGLIRRDWRGFSGGTEVWQQIESFFAELKERAVY